MPIVAEITVRPHVDNFDDVIARITKMIETTRSFPGCLGASMRHDTTSYEIFLTHSWESADALDAYLDARAERGDFEFFSKWLIDEPCFNIQEMPEQKRNSQE